MFYWINQNKTVKELRKSASLTVKELAEKVNWDTVQIQKLDNTKLKDLPEEIKQQLIPIFRQDHL
ncbi:transcriptional regulator [Natronincola peptidivorans]|uniref:transcriptional regulator n=1 Tax=Natronincola peptidivorans TaxID=426128 RepID=UPI001FCAA2D3|nr:transcriptional regulator [Natronincola peptidivorans]